MTCSGNCSCKSKFVAYRELSDGLLGEAVNLLEEKVGMIEQKICDRIIHLRMISTRKDKDIFMDEATARENELQSLLEDWFGYMIPKGEEPKMYKIAHSIDEFFIATHPEEIPFVYKYFNIDYWQEMLESEEMTPEEFVEEYVEELSDDYTFNLVSNVPEQNSLNGEHTVREFLDGNTEGYPILFASSEY